MGVCVTKPGVVVAGGDLPGPGECIAVSQQPILEDYTQPIIDKIAPGGFHPELSMTIREKKCQKTICALQPMVYKSQSPQDLVDSWEKNGFLTVINNQVFSLSAANTMSVFDLAHYLTEGSSKYIKELKDNFSIGVAKAYAIFFWITNNIEWSNLSSNRKNDCSLIVEIRKGTSLDFSSLFNALCVEAGIKSEKIEGNIRRWRNSADTDFHPDSTNYHAWNVVTIENTPILVDCSLGSGYINSSSEFVKTCTRHYFAVPPQYLILTHLPADPLRQFLNSPLTVQELQPIIPVPMTTLCMGLQPLSWSEVIDVPKGVSDPVVSITMKLNDSSNKYIYAKLVSQTHSVSESVSESDQSELQNCTYVSQIKENIFEIQAVISNSGTFILCVYLCKDIPENQLDHPCLSYVIKSDLVQKDKVGYPFFHPLSAKAFEFKPLYWGSDKKSYNCVHSNQVFSFVFEASSDVSFHHYLIKGKVTKPNMSQLCDVHRHNTLIVANKQNIYKLLAVFPDEGWWTIHLFATRVSRFEEEISGYTSLLTYHVFANSGSPNLSYPRSVMPHTVLFDTNPVAVAKNPDVLTTIQFATSKVRNFYHYLTFSQPNGKSWEGYSNVEVASEYDNSFYTHYKLHVIFPKAGLWFVHLFGKTRNESYDELFELKIDVFDPTLNTLLVQNNASLQKKFNIDVMNHGIITFTDDGQPFSFKFTAPHSNINFAHDLISDDNIALDYCTFLSVDNQEEQNTPHTLHALFPTAGNFTLRLCIKEDEEDAGNNLLFEIKLTVKNPVLEYCYPKLYPAFSSIGCRILEPNALLQSSCHTGELKLTFQAPKNVHFFCKVQNQTNSEHNDLSQLAIVHNFPESEDKTLHCLFPDLGEWKLILYARILPEPVENDYTPILQISTRNMLCKANFSFPLLYEGFYNSLNLYFDPDDLPLPSLLHVGKGPAYLVIKFYSPPSVKFTHYAEVKCADSEIPEHVLTRMMSNIDSGLCELQVEVLKTGQWTVFVYAKSTMQLQDESEGIMVMQYAFCATNKN